MPFTNCWGFERENCFTSLFYEERICKNKKRRFDSAFEKISLAKISVQVEIDFHRNLNGHRMAIFHSGLKFPILNGFDGFFVESHSQATEHSDIAGTPVRADDQRRCDRHALRDLGDEHVLPR